MSYTHTTDIVIPCQETSPNTFNISQEYFKEMSNFSCDKRARFIYIILKTDDKGNFISGYSGKKTADKISEANSYYGSSSDSNFFKEVIQANRHLYRFIVIGYCKNKEELGYSEDAINTYFKKKYGSQWSNKNLGNGKYSTEGLISIIKEDKNKKVRNKFVREEELDSYLSQGWCVKGHSTGLIAISKEDNNKFVREEELDSYLSQGWTKGTSLKGLVSIVKNGTGKRIRGEELDSYLSQGWELGTSFIGLISIYKEDQNKFIKEEELDSYLSQGWSKGTSLKGSISIFKGDETKRVKKEELDSYLSQGWSKGNKLNKGLIGITKEGKEKRVNEEKLEFYLSQGWTKGRLNSLLTLKRDFEEHKINLERLDDIISYLKSDWKIPLKTVHIHNKSLLRGTSIILSEDNSYTRLIEFLEKGWVFGGLPKELVFERNKIRIAEKKLIIKNKELIEKRKKVLTEKDKENKRLAANRPHVKEKQKIARLGRKWCNNGIEELWLFTEELHSKLKEGWVEGRLKKISLKIKEKKSTAESKQKRSILSQDAQANKPMLDLEGNLKLVHKGLVLEKLRLGWKLKLKSVGLWNPETGHFVVLSLRGVEVNSSNMIKKTIRLLEIGYVFGYKSRLVEKTPEATTEYCDKRKMWSLF